MLNIHHARIRAIQKSSFNLWLKCHFIIGGPLQTLWVQPGCSNNQINPQRRNVTGTKGMESLKRQMHNRGQGSDLWFAFWISVYALKLQAAERARQMARGKTHYTSINIVLYRRRKLFDMCRVLNIEVVPVQIPWISCVSYIPRTKMGIVTQTLCRFHLNTHRHKLYDGTPFLLMYTPSDYQAIHF